MTVRRLNEPVAATVRLDEQRRPRFVQWNQRGYPQPKQGSVEQVLDSWYVDEGWWTDTPVRRMYYECQLSEGARVIAVYDLAEATWYVQH